MNATLTMDLQAFPDKEMRVADWLTAALLKCTDKHVFMVTGGGAMHLNDAFGRNQSAKVTCFHHEQAAAIAAESYGRLTGRPVILNVTTGPGGINALNGVYGAFVDSIPMVIVSGQVKRETIARNYSRELRQLGDQEADIFEMVKPIVKYAAIVSEPHDIRAVVEKACALAVDGRPGPVWIDVPIDVQAARIIPNQLAGWCCRVDTQATELEWIHPNTLVCTSGFEQEGSGQLISSAAEIIGKLKQAKRPVVLAGSGVRLSGAYEEFLRLVDMWKVPVVTGWNAHDLLPNAHQCFAGRPGTVGDRAGNFTVQNADFLLVLGSRLNIRQISYGWKNFAPGAWKAHVDIDQAELDKPTLSFDLKVRADLKCFIRQMISQCTDYAPDEEHGRYLVWCQERVRKYPVVQERYWDAERVNPYCFMSVLFDRLEEDDIVVTGDGTACVVAMQAACIKPGQRLYTNSGCASMGYDLPAAIGAAIARYGQKIICIAGDGSIMMNLQELQTIVGLGLPIKIFILNNEGYHSIRQTQNAYFPGNEVGVGPKSGLTFPNFTRIANAFGLVATRIESTNELAGQVASVLNGDGPIVCEVMLDLDQGFEPKLASRRLEDGTMVSPSLEDMAPFLSREELRQNML